ncbi:MAG TPA: hypothetical protein VN642_15535 [Dongiaceae bacterium]|nr:hypothetical protein [Dongiaceae bacterium]
MSYILDALKKIEHEKNKKKLPDGRVSISGDLFQDRKQPPARAGFWKILVLVAAASLVTCAGTWFLLRGTGKRSTAIVRPSAPPPVASEKPPVAVTPAAAVPVPAPAQSQLAPAAMTPAAVPPAPVAAAPVAAPPADAVGDDETSRREARRAQRGSKAQPPATLPKQASQTVQAPADIKLSGIAWQDDRSARRAVVNGFLLKEGAVVSGAKIIDIQADRVRFSSAAGPFEIKLDAVLPAEVKK